MSFEDVADFRSWALAQHLKQIAVVEQGIIGLALSMCESPIEARMAIALRYAKYPIYGGGDVMPNISPGGYRFVEHAINGQFKDKDVLVIYPQYQIGRYRADFALFAKFYNGPVVHKLVIECDGHDFHEKTKIQAQRDKKRDRDLTAAGYQVFRFTGSEIFRDAPGCAKEIGDYLDQKFWDVENASTGEAA